jgi:hemolysin III
LSLNPAPAYSDGERRADVLAHIFAVGASLAGLIMLVLVAGRHGGALTSFSFALYGGTLLLVFAASALYNMMPPGALKKILRLIDHSTIYLMIAGTYTPICLNSLAGAWGWSLFAAVWGLALCGVALKLLYPGRLEKLAIGLYFATGWIGLAAIGPLVENLPWAALALLGIGGVFYSAGVIFHLSASLRYQNVIWHGFVMAGAACHYFAVIFFVRPVV